MNGIICVLVLWGKNGEMCIRKLLKYRLEFLWKKCK